MSNKVFVGNQAVGLETSPAFEPFRAVKLWFDDDRNYFSGIVVSDSGEETSYHSESEWNKAGGTGRVMEEECRWATQTMADNVLKNIKGYVYKPFLGSGALLNQAAELGDGVTIGGTYGLLAAINTTFDAMCTSDIESPADEEIDHEYPYLSPEDRALKRKVTLGESYYGTRITRAKGLEIVKTAADGTQKSRARLNADELSFYDDNGGQALYFDPATGRYMFRGDVTVTGSLTMIGTSNWLLTRYSTSKDAAIPDGWSQNWDDSWDNSSTRVWAIYSYDGGTNWSQPMMIQGSDGAQGPQGPSGSSASIPAWVRAYTASAEYDTLVTDEWVVSMNLYSSNIYAGNGSNVYARVDGESFGLYAEGLTNARALLEAGTSQVRLILGAGSEANDSVAGRFFIQKGLDIAGLYLNSEDEGQDFGFTIQSNGTITAHANKLSGFYLTFS